MSQASDRFEKDSHNDFKPVKEPEWIWYDFIGALLNPKLIVGSKCKACGAKDDRHCDRRDCPTLLDKVI